MMSEKDNKGTIKLTDITPHNIRNFLEGTRNSLSSRNLQKHEQEQVIYRAAKCKDCLELGRCHTCGCSTPGLFYSPKKRDAAGKWGPMLGPIQWEAFKKTIEYKQTMNTNNTVTDGTDDTDARIIARSDGGRVLVRKVDKEVPEDKTKPVVGSSSKET